MFLDKYLNIQFLPHRQHNNLNYKDHPFTKLTAVYCQSYEVQKPNMCAKYTCS